MEIQDFFIYHSETLVNHNRLKSALLDIFPTETQKINLILMAYDIGIVQQMQSAKIIEDSLSSRMESTLMNQFGISKENAHWAIEYWKKAYGEKVLHKRIHHLPQMKQQPSTVKQKTKPTPAPTSTSPPTPQPSRRKSSRGIWGVGAAMLVCIAVGLAVGLNVHSPDSTTDDTISASNGGAQSAESNSNIEDDTNDNNTEPEQNDDVEYVTGNVTLSSETSVNPDLYPHPERTLTYSSVKIMVGDDVKYVQAALIEMAYTGVSVNGYYDAGTYDAVKRFQKNHGYTQNGTIDTTMVKNIALALQIWRQKQSEAASTASAEDTSSNIINADLYSIPERSLEYRAGDLISGDDVKYVQAALIEMNYNGITLNGKYDADTEAAVIRFQKNHNLYVDGVVGEKTTAALQEALITWRIKH